MNDNSSKFGWFLAGTLLGGALGLLFAPKSGKEIRHDIKRSADSSREAMEASGKEMMERGKELYERGRQVAEDASQLFERGKKLVQG